MVPCSTRAVNVPGAATGIAHLPVAPQVTVMSRFSSVLPQRLPFLTPEEALARLDVKMASGPETPWMAAISGPGDPLAVPDTLLHTLALVRNRYPQLKLGMRTVGFGSRKFAAALAEAGLDYVELEIDSLNAEILETLYAWIRPGLRTISIAEGVALLLDEQKHGVPALRYQGIAVTVVTTLYPGHNIDHVGQIAATMMELGAGAIALQPHQADPGAEVVLPPVSAEDLGRATRLVEPYLPIADALLTAPCAGSMAAGLFEPETIRPTVARPHVAVISSNGMEVDLHLGQAQRFLIYGQRDDGLACMLETRQAPASGSGINRWLACAELLVDCCVLLAAEAGQTPRSVLAEHGLFVMLTTSQIDPIVDQFYSRLKRKKKQ